MDRWAIDKLTERDLKSINGYKARLITFDELVDNLGYEYKIIITALQGYIFSETTPNWVYNDNYWYWTMTPYESSKHQEIVWSIKEDGKLTESFPFTQNAASVRPVINLLKSAI